MGFPRQIAENTESLISSIDSGVKAADSASIDAFGRWRTSNPVTLFDSKSLYDAQPLYFSDATESGGAGGSSLWVDTDATVRLSVSASTAGTRVRQSRRRMPYQPGKSQLILMTFVLGAAAPGITRRVGYFDQDNGIFLEQTATGLRFVIRKNGVDDAFEQADWSNDTFADIDVTKSQILYIDFEWLGVGRTRMGFVVDGVFRLCHAHVHANVESGVYMASPNQPVRWEIGNDGTGGAADLDAICSTVISEGGVDRTGLIRSVDRSTTGLVTLNDGDLYPLLAVRLKQGYLGATVRAISTSVFCNSTAAYRWALLLNPTVTGTALSFSDVTDSAIQADAARTNATKVSGGTLLASGYGESTVSNSVPSGGPNDYALGSAVDGTSDILVLAVQRLSGTTETFYGTLTYLEQV